MASNEAVQLIDEDKVFHAPQLTPASNYHVIAVFGSQSTGKSTLLNSLFHTRFDVMNESRRQQTTKGIWMAESPQITSNSETITDKAKDTMLLVMDVEGSDGRERGEDQDFERKAALFALSTSEILIVNIWEHQVGLYQGANMGLLKTVFEVNLSLFGGKDKKVGLLFVIRDHIGSTPLENLKDTLTADLNKMWDSIAKPPTAPECQLSDYFDLEFHALGHKILQPEQFDADVKDLGDRLSGEKSLFKKEYDLGMPLDGWPFYASNCWDMIESNKDLDLPTQQVLVARFRCEEIAKESFEVFNTEFEKEFTNVKFDELTGDSLALKFKELRDIAWQSYDSQASHYKTEVYKEKYDVMNSQINAKLLELTPLFIKNLKKSSCIKFKEFISSGKGSFLERSALALETVIKSFSDAIAPIAALDDSFNFTTDLEEFTSDINRDLAIAKGEETKSLVSKLTKTGLSIIKSEVSEIFTTATEYETIWDDVLKTFNGIVDSSLLKFKTAAGYHFQIDASPEANEEILNTIKASFWSEFDSFIHEHLSEDNVVSLLKRHFDESFNYDNGIPRTWKTELQITQVYKQATDSALQLLPILAIAKLSNGTEILPEVPINDTTTAKDGDLDPHCFAHILTSTQQLKIKRSFLRSAELSHRDATRSIISNVTKIPPFIYVLLIILGWNEFMAILRNPVYLILALLIGTALFFVNALGLWGPVGIIVDGAVTQGKQWLMQQLEGHQNEKQGFVNENIKEESYELKDMSGKNNQ